MERIETLNEKLPTNYLSSGFPDNFIAGALAAGRVRRPPDRRVTQKKRILCHARTRRFTLPECPVTQLIPEKN